MPIEPGTALGAYEVHEFLGQGAMGTVYRAFHAGLARPAAVKVLQAIAPDPDATARFRREAQSIAQMRHPNVLNVYDFGEYEGTPYMIVEYMPGGSLSDRMKAGERFDRPTALRLLEGIAAALDYAHSVAIIHRDVKPANVLLDGRGNPVLADFGLAKLLQSASVKTVSGVTTGTPAYMSPEQVMGSAVGPPADTYALTTMAYEFLAGAIPFEGEGMLELLYAHVHREPPAASSRNPELSPRPWPPNHRPPSRRRWRCRWRCPQRRRRQLRLQCRRRSSRRRPRPARPAPPPGRRRPAGDAFEPASSPARWASSS